MTIFFMLVYGEDSAHVLLQLSCVRLWNGLALIFDIFADWKQRFQKSSKVGSKRDKRKTAQDSTTMVESCK